jgi:hypothetical protein
MSFNVTRENKDKIGNENVTFWGVLITVVAVKIQQCILCVA